MIIISKDALNRKINHIKGLYGRIDTQVHEAAVQALYYLNLPEVQDTGYAQRLVEAMGKSARRETLKAWFMHFGKCQLKDGVLVFKKRRDITPENFNQFVMDADAKPFWETAERTAEQQARDMDAEAEFIRLFIRLQKAGHVAHGDLMTKAWEAMPDYVKNKVIEKV